MAAAPAPGTYMVQLDALRALAVLGVIVQHFIPSEGRGHINFGAPGVRLFFVISGFLITGLLLRARQQAEQQNGSSRQILFSFYARRFLRIFPLYYFVLALTGAMGVAVVLDDLVWHACYLSNVFFAIHGMWNGAVSHLWSLSVEEQFYIVWPMLMVLTPRHLLRQVIILSIMIAPVSRAILLMWTDNSITTMVLTVSCLDTLGLGALLAIACHEAQSAPNAEDRDRRYRAIAKTVRAAGIIGFVMTAALVCYQMSQTGRRILIVGGDLAYGLLFVAVVYGAACGYRGRVARVMEWSPLVYLGKISYGMYLFHNFVPEIVAGFERQYDVGLGYPGKGPAGLVYVYGVTFMLSSATWFLFEKRLNRLKRFFPYVGPGLRMPKRSVARHVAG